MSTSTPANPDTPVTLKVSFLGSTRRLTLPLSEVSSYLLLNKIRQLLSISPDANAIFERHSDSAAAYVELDPSNTAVWKQLYRAAKAKRKLKLRVTLHDSEEEQDQQEDEIDQQGTTTRPKPVTVEDEPEQQQVQDFSQPKAEELMLPSPFAPATNTNSHPASEPSSPIKTNDTPLETAMSKLRLGSEKQEQMSTQPTESMCIAPKAANFAVCCNHCDRTIKDAHYHCSTCDEGDFDLCPNCVERGVTCYDPDHWLLKRFVRGDFILVSTTERVSPRPRVKGEVFEEELKVTSTACAWSAELSDAPVESRITYRVPMPLQARTCNSCIQELPDNQFLHCKDCADFDLCKACFSNNKHGHHPQHRFVPAVDGTVLSSEIMRRLAPGRDQRHNAICDGCDKFISGVRHKCLDCPDWDYCADCVTNAGFVHPNHRFVPIYEQIGNVDPLNTAARPTHYGICCDGPLCNDSRKTYIVGDRFKCAVCHDTDFCANCEASPANTHNKTHPLVKFRTPVRRVEVKTKGEDENGNKMPVMGDRLRPKTASPRADTVPQVDQTARTVVDGNPKPESVPGVASTTSQLERILQRRTAAYANLAAAGSAQSEAAKAKFEALNEARLDAMRAVVYSQHKPVHQLSSAEQQPAGFESQRRIIEAQRQAISNATEAQRQVTSVPAEAKRPASVVTSDSAVKPSPIAIFERDTVADGTVMPPNQVFEQTWVLRNGGDAPWPAGCSVKFVGGDYMGHVDSSHPAGIHDLVSASESTVCYNALAPGQTFPFTVLLRTPAREGRVISYWRLHSDDGMKFGHRLWCDVSVRNTKPVDAPEVAQAPEEPAPDMEVTTSEAQSETSTEKSVEKSAQKSAESSQMIFPKVDKETFDHTVQEEEVTWPAPGNDILPPSDDEYLDEYEICGEDETWAEDSDEGLLTDEEYDILDASDEEYLDEQQKKSQK